MARLINPTVETAQTLSEQIAAVAFLPAISLAVYESLLNGLYAEVGFSDVEAEDIVAATGMSTGAVAGALGYLVEHGLIWVDDCKVNNKKHRFLFPRFWNVMREEDGQAAKTAMYEAIAARKQAGQMKHKRPSRAGKSPKSPKAPKVVEAPVLPPNFKVRITDGETTQWLAVRADNAVEARKQAELVCAERNSASQDAFEVTGRAYPIKAA